MDEMVSNAGRIHANSGHVDVVGVEVLAQDMASFE